MTVFLTISSISITADVVIVDEAQDFMDVEGIEMIESLCGSDLDNGRWRIETGPGTAAAEPEVLRRCYAFLLRLPFSWHPAHFGWIQCCVALP